LTINYKFTVRFILSGSYLYFRFTHHLSILLSKIISYSQKNSTQFAEFPSK